MEKNESHQKPASKTLSKMKLNIMGSLKNVSRKESVAPSEGPEGSNPTASNIAGKKPQPAARKGITTTEKDLKKKTTCLSSFKVKSGFLGGKKKKTGTTGDKGKFKEIKRRLFFQKKSEYSDEEILRNLGTDNLQKVVGQSLEEIANAASFMKKFLQLKDSTRSNHKWPQMTSVFVGSIKGCDPQILRNTAVSTTIFLGKMISKKDKHGLYRGSESGTSSADSLKDKDNPLLVALAKIKSKHRSLDSTESHPASPNTQSAEPKVDFEETITSLRSGLLQVKLGNIKDWNIHKNIISDTELKTISILF